MTAAHDAYARHTLTDPTESAASEMAVAAAHDDKVRGDAGDRGEKDLDRAAFFDNGIEGHARVDKGSGPVFTHPFGRPCRCTVVQLLNARLITEVSERRRELHRVHSSEMRVTAVGCRPDRGIRGLGEAVDPDHDLTQQRVGPDRSTTGTTTTGRGLIAAT